MLGPSLGTSATTLWSAGRRAPGRRLRRGRPGTCPGTATTRRCRPSRSRWPSWPRACCTSSTTCSPRGASPAAPSPTPATRSAARSGCSCCSTRPGRITSAVLLCTGARIGDAAVVGASGSTRSRASGTPVMVAGSAERWFGAGFLDREPDRASALLHALADADRRGLRAGLRGARRASTSATGSARSTCRCWPWPGRRTSPPRPRSCARSPTASPTAAASSCPASPTWRPPRRPRSSPA